MVKVSFGENTVKWRVTEVANKLYVQVRGHADRWGSSGLIIRLLEALGFGMVRDMANLRDQFASYYKPDQEAVAAALRTGIVVPDTNVLLAAYRFERQARNELFGAFEKLEDRLWIPNQVGLEFHRNRLNAMATHEALFGKTRDELEGAVSSYLAKFRAFTGRIAMPRDRTQALEQMIRDAHGQVEAEVTAAEEASEAHLHNHDSDEVLARLEAIFIDGRVGEPMTPEQFEAARKEARRRVEHKIPPGYADRDKADSTGDYLLWRQLLEKAGTRRLPVILVTDDQKDDWVRREHGKTLGPRPELYEEMSAAAGEPFHLMSTETFLWHAKEYLGVSVSPGTVDQARELPAALHARQRAVGEEARYKDATARLNAKVRALQEQLEIAQTDAAAAVDRAAESQRAAVASGSESEEARQEARHREIQAIKVRARAEAQRNTLAVEMESVRKTLGALDEYRRRTRIDVGEADRRYQELLSQVLATGTETAGE